jgi:hypothetical protein
MEYINEFAEQMLDTAYDVITKTKYWYTLDGKEFTDVCKAINHQIEYLMEEVDKD